MLEVLLTREDANTEFALLAEWLVADGETVAGRDAVCVVETSKATVEVEAPGAGVLVHLFAAGNEVELGGAVALIAESDAELVEARGRAAPAAELDAGDAPRATRKARELAARHGIDLAAIDKRGFITTGDVEALVSAPSGTPSGTSPGLSGTAAAPDDSNTGLLAGLSTAGVTLPDSWSGDAGEGELDPAFLAQLREDPGEFLALSSAQKCEAYRSHGAVIGDDVVLGNRALIIAGRLVLEDGVELGERARVECTDAFCIGTLTRIGRDVEVSCRRAYLGTNVYGGREVRIGGGGRRDPWAILAIGDRAYLGDETFVNVCRPVLIGQETFVTQRSMIVTQQHRPLAARGLRESLRTGGRRGLRPGRSGCRRLRRLPHRRARGRCVELLRRL